MCLLLCSSRRGEWGEALRVDYSILKKSNKHIILTSGVFCRNQEFCIQVSWTHSDSNGGNDTILSLIMLGFKIFVSLLHLIS